MKMMTEEYGKRRGGDKEAKGMNVRKGGGDKDMKYIIFPGEQACACAKKLRSHDGIYRESLLVYPSPFRNVKEKPRNVTATFSHFLPYHYGNRLLHLIILK
jgi:hypothetical protein